MILRSLSFKYSTLPLVFTTGHFSMYIFARKLRYFGVILG